MSDGLAGRGTWFPALASLSRDDRMWIRLAPYGIKSGAGFFQITRY
jgi:hypothetical protein